MSDNIITDSALKIFEQVYLIQFPHLTGLHFNEDELNLINQAVTKIENNLNSFKNQLASRKIKKNKEIAITITEANPTSEQKTQFDILSKKLLDKPFSN